MGIDINTIDIKPISLTELRNRFDLWSVSRSEYLEFVFHHREFDEISANRVIADFLQIETTLLLSAVNRSSRVIKSGRLSYLVNAPGRRGQNQVILQPRGQRTEICFGDYAGEFYLSTYMDAECLPHVTDDFWEHVVALSKYDGFKYSDNSSPKTPTSEAKALRRSGRSEIYKLIRDFTMHKICGGDIENLGCLEVRWPVETEWGLFWEQFEEALKRLARINNALHRVRYLEQKRLARIFLQRTGHAFPSQNFDEQAP